MTRNLFLILLCAFSIESYAAGRKIVSVPVQVSITAAPAQGSNLAALAQSLKPGQWGSLTSKNINNVLGDSSGNTATGDILPYAEGMAWDPVLHRIFYVGSDHNYAPSTYQSTRFVYYDETTNTWVNTNQPPQNLGIAHAYDHNTLDPATGDFFFANYSDFGTATIRRYNVRTGSSWSDFAVGPAPSLQAALTFFPDMNALMFITTTQVLKYQSGGNWANLGSLTGVGGYHIFAEHNPVHKLILLGGGNGSSTMYKLSSAGVLTKLKDAPIELSIPMIEITVDPVSGEYIVISQIDNSFRAYNVLTDTWRTLPAPSASVWNTQGQDVFHIAAVPISNYGVIMFVTCDGSTDCRMNVYKHQ